MSEDLHNQRRRKASFSDEKKPTRLPPYSHEAEQGVLGCVLLDPACLSQCVERFKAGAEMFYDLRHQTVYQAMVDMHGQFDIITLQEELRTRKQLDKVGGLAYLTSLPDVVPSAANLGYYLEIMLEKYALRRMVHTCTAIVSRVYEATGPVDDLLGDAERDVLAVAESLVAGVQTQTSASLYRASIDKIERLHQSRGQVSGLPTGLSDLDKICDGLHPGDFVVVAAVEKTGKTSFAMGIADHAAVEHGVAVGVLSLEMNATDLMTRMLCSRARVSLDAVRAGSMVEQDFANLTLAADRLRKAPLYFDDESDCSIVRLRAKARRWRQQYGVGLIVVDYIQRVTAEVQRGGTREQEVAAVSRGLAAMAKELRVPVLGLSQVNEDGATRESRGLQHDCTALWKLKPNGDETAEVAPVGLEVALSRNSGRGFVALNLLKAYTRFEQAAKVDVSDYTR